jgi:hypothetical protein
MNEQSQFCPSPAALFFPRKYFTGVMPPPKAARVAGRPEMNKQSQFRGPAPAQHLWPASQSRLRGSPSTFGTAVRFPDAGCVARHRRGSGFGPSLTATPRNFGNKCFRVTCSDAG